MFIVTEYAALINYCKSKTTYLVVGYISSFKIVSVAEMVGLNSTW